MRPDTRRMRLESWAELVQEWKNSGKNKDEFAESIGMSSRNFRYRFTVLRKEAPELLGEEKEFFMLPIPQEESTADPEPDRENQNVMTICIGSASMSITNQVAPELLRVVMEVMMSC